ncbi:sensor domain-containing diguanylate cyclase [Neptuniibacter halophilus]|uniref:sensor domain-containing diguanylate cyclase n=1 Tax=Neptuniibacter halophilus TaxID=651666 RepID=UPI0025737EB2|nr:sensor domain-containing diguanylate cyclase [Neptuniibacter halophilus]
MTPKLVPVAKRTIKPAPPQMDPAMLLQTFDRITLPTFVLDKEHKVIHWNCALEQLSGVNRSEVLGTRDHWRPFYSSPRPCLADLILDGGRWEDVQHYYADKCVRSELIADAYEGEDFFPDCGDSGEWLHFTAATILDAEGEIIGVIETLENISARKKAEFELREREQLYKHLSITDSLTNLHNSRHFYSQLEQMVETARRYHHGFALCFFDLDNFKQLNDNFGHLMGDKVLETFGVLIRSSLRAPDTGYRYGGEEFAILLPSTDLDGAHIVADRVRRSLQNYQFLLDNGDRVQSSVSIGITVYRAGDSPQSLMERADKALYQAKDAGKNCIIGI